MGMRLSLPSTMAPRMARATSLATLMPRPMGQLGSSHRQQKQSKAHLKEMPGEDTASTDAIDSLITAHRLLHGNPHPLAVEASSLISQAYSLHFREEMPLIQRKCSDTSDICPELFSKIASLLANVQLKQRFPQSLFRSSRRALSCINTARELLTTALPLIECHRHAVAATASVPGDIPALLELAYSSQLGRDMHVDMVPGQMPQISSTDELLTTLTRLPPLKNAARVWVHRARSILTDGPPLSMNVELDVGEELPVALHTLLQGTIWAILMEAGANPDLFNKMHRRIVEAFTPDAKCLWFLCRKFFFTMNVAEKDGEIYKGGDQATKVYTGLVLAMDPDAAQCYRRMRVPRVSRLVEANHSYLAVTPRGLWVWGWNAYGQLGFSARTKIVNDPARLAFKQCPEVVEYEAGLLPWRKDKLVTRAWMGAFRSFIITPVGLLVAGEHMHWFVPDYSQFKTTIAQVPLPDVPDNIISTRDIIIASLGDRQVITGCNKNARLGLGHSADRDRFEPLECPYVDRILVSSAAYNILVCGKQLMFAGVAPRALVQLGVLPGIITDRCCTSFIPLVFPQPVKRFHVSKHFACYVSEGSSHCWCRTATDFVNDETGFDLDFEVLGFHLAYPALFIQSPSGWLEMADGVLKRGALSVVPTALEEVDVSAQ
ncbi:hypothetical protein J8273_8897 [Carpediemonas membranifera]|uniref:Uncharacterized protein n=1 Tax=Carpediemonas membranifera TaxID=201153 RepID=A0A8J6DX86_9EUKA|nr:hypothetical protein J8273_8897 [Carpediemonas membranifera]|eukprot:KAG9389604.1 hypothetical protein J8273_8897 [Carpediemonas membranifera]